MENKKEMANKQFYLKLEEYLREFSKEAENWFNTILNDPEKNFLKDFDSFYRDFLKRDLTKLGIEDIEELVSHTHSFNRLPLAKAKAVNNLPNDLGAFYELLNDFDTNDIDYLNKEIEKRVTNAAKNIKFWGISSISELIGQKFPHHYVFYNFRDREALTFLNLHTNIFKSGDKKTIGKEFIAYSKFMQQIVFPLYKSIVKINPKYKNINNEEIELPIGIQVDQFFSWLYETKIKEIQKNSLFKQDEKGLEAYTNERLEKVTIKNYFSIKDVKIENFKKNEIYFLGENGVGKTILFQAILLAAKWNLIKKQPNVEVGIIKDYVNYNKDLIIEYKFLNEQPFEITAKDNLEKESELFLKNFFAYGTSRTIINNEKNGTFEYLTLFGYEKKIINPVDWLIKGHNRELENKIKKIKNRFLKLEKVKEILIDILDKQVTINISFDNVTFVEQGAEPIEFAQLSDGYKSVLSWVVDMLARLSENQPNIDEPSDFVGTVLIDELDLFLHPKWAYKIMEKLRGWFPSIQFIISTHSPSLILGASEDAIFYKVYKENGETKITEPVSGISNLMANSVLTSPLFDLEFAGSREMKKDDFYKKNLDTSGHFNIYKINQGIEKRIKAERANLKIQITENEIEKWVEEALNEAEREMK